MAWNPLGSDQKRYLCDEIARQVSSARDPGCAAWAVRLIHECFWFWTADGVDGHGRVGRDKLKYSVDHLWHSEGACGLSREACQRGDAPAVRHQASNLRHEHAVPRKLILERLMVGEPLAQAELLALLERLCLGVVLTREEDAQLNAQFQRSMPPAWDITDPAADVFARYRHPSVGLFPRLHPPRGRQSSQPGDSMPRKAGPRLVPLHPRQGAPASSGSGGDPIDTSTTLEVISELQRRFALRNEHFRLLHHGKRPSLANHVAYCRERTRFTTHTNADVFSRLQVCLAQLDQGASWDQAIAAALARFPLPVEQ
jgi:hypothetical protein